MRRTIDPADRRRTLLELAAKAIAPLHASYGRTDERFDEITRQFTPVELEAVSRFLDAVSDFYAISGN